MFFVEPALDKCLSTTVGWAMYDYLSQFIVPPSKNIINGYGHMMDMRIEDNPDHPDKLQLLHMDIYWYRWNKNPKDLLLSNPVICTRTTSYKRHLDLLLCTQDMSLYMHLRELHNLKKIYELIKKKNKHFIVRVLILRKLRRANVFVFRKTPTGTYKWGCINSG